MESKPELRPDQLSDFAAVIKFGKFGLWTDPGGGKTPISCIESYYAWSAKGQRSAWAQPSSLLHKNREEILRFSHFKPEDVVVVEGTPTKRQEIMKSDAKVFLFTFSGWSKEGFDLLKYHPDVKVNVIDEFHLGYSGHKSQRTQNWYILARHMETIVPMTGTVIKGKLDSAYPLFHVMAPLYYGTYEAFMNFHCIRDDYGGILGWKNHEILGLRLGAIGVRRSLSSIFGDQAKIFQVERCQMSKTQRKMYDKFEGSGLIELEESFIKAEGGGVKAIRKRQIMAHPETFELEIPGGRTGKDERMWIHIEDHIRTGEQLCIFSALVPEQERVYKQMLDAGLRVALINGSVSAKDRARIDEQFRSGALQFVVGSPATMAVGFNWGMLNTIIYVSIDYGDDSFIQAYSRAIRGKRAKPLLIIVLEYEDSIDQDIFKIVQAKSTDANLIDETKDIVKLGAGDDLTAWLKEGLKK